MSMKFLYHKSSGRIYEVVSVDATTGMATLKNAMATFSDTIDADKLAARGYIRVSGETEAEAREKAEAKVAAEKETA